MDRREIESPIHWRVEALSKALEGGRLAWNPKRRPFTDCTGAADQERRRQAQQATGQGFLGYGDNRTLTEDNHFEKADRQFFLKLSYAFQR